MNFVNDYNMQVNSQVNGYYYPIDNAELFFNNVRTHGKLYVADFLNKRQGIKDRACYLLNQSEKGKEEETIIKFIRNEFMSMAFPLYGFFSFIIALPKDIEDILVAQTLDSCGDKKTADFYKALGIIGTIVTIIGVASAATWLGKQLAS